MLGEESRLDTCAAIRMPKPTSSRGLSNYTQCKYNIGSLVCRRAKRGSSVYVCVKETVCVSNMDDVRAIREHMNHHWGGNDLGAPRRRVNYSITPELGSITHYLLVVSEVIL